MMVWDVMTKTHEVLAHTGFLTPHGELTYPDGELRLPNEIDLPLITLGATVDGAFQQALADAIDPMGNLDKDSRLFVGHSVPDPRYPYYPVLQYEAQPDGTRSTRLGVPPPVGLPEHRASRDQRGATATAADADREVRPQPLPPHPGRPAIPGRSPAPTRRAPHRTRCSSDGERGPRGPPRLRGLARHPWRPISSSEYLFGAAAQPARRPRSVLGVPDRSAR